MDNSMIQVVTSGQPEYPARLKEIRDHPKTLYYIGAIGMLRQRCVAVVGSRTTTSYGRNTARAIGTCLARHGVTVVSGMAAGIDTCAHEGALSAGGNTAAVLGCGPDVCYPAENKALKACLQRQGLILSEYEPGTQPMPFRFPQRNRIISGICEMTVVVQARNRSGALITAELAAEQGREVMAVPGNIDSQYNLGTNKLIREGVCPVISPEDVLEPLGLKKISAEAAAERLSESEILVFRILEKHGELSADEVCGILQRPPAYVNPILSALEIKGFIYSNMGKFFLAKP